MKRLVLTVVCIIASVAAFVSCEPKQVPDGKCEITSFALTAALNSSLSADIVGVVDGNEKTITLVKPASVSATSFIPTFEATEWDDVVIENVLAKSGETTVTIVDGARVNVTDQVSDINVQYRIVVLSNDEEAVLTSAVFKKADNDKLAEDVAPEAIAPEMVVRVPGAAFRQELVLTVAAGDNDVIKVNNEEVASGSSIKVDTNFPIDIVVSDAVAGKNVKYVLKVGKILEVVVSKFGSYAEGTMNDFTMAVNPNDGAPYFAYTRKLDGEKNNGVSVAKWNGSAFELVGPTGVADASARSASKPKVAFAKDGSVYAYYLAGDVASKPTVRKLDGGAWAVVGAAGITPQNCNTSYLYPFFIHPATGKPAFFWNGNTKNQASYRVMNYAGFSGDAWSVNVVGNAPALGSGGTTNSGMYYTSSAVVTSEKVYIGSSFNEFGYYVHEVAGDGTLTPVVDNFLPTGAPYGLPGNLQLSGSDDALYLLAADASANILQVYSVDKSGKTLKPYGAGIPVTISASGSITENAGFAVNPNGGLIIAAVDQAEKVPGFFYLNESLQWDAFKVDAPVANKSVYYVAFNKDGKGFIAYLSANGIELYGAGLEDDILPE